MRDLRARPLLEVVRRKPLVVRPGEALEVSPRPACDPAEQRTIVSIESTPPHRPRTPERVRHLWRGKPHDEQRRRDRERAWTTQRNRPGRRDRKRRRGPHFLPGGDALASVRELLRRV